MLGVIVFDGYYHGKFNRILGKLTAFALLGAVQFGNAFDTAS